MSGPTCTTALTLIRDLIRDLGSPQPLCNCHYRRCLMSATSAPLPDTRTRSSPHPRTPFALFPSTHDPASMASPCYIFDFSFPLFPISSYSAFIAHCDFGFFFTLRSPPSSPPLLPHFVPPRYLVTRYSLPAT